MDTLLMLVVGVVLSSTVLGYRRVCEGMRRLAGRVRRTTLTQGGHGWKR